MTYLALVHSGLIDRRSVEILYLYFVHKFSAVMLVSKRTVAVAAVYLGTFMATLAISIVMRRPSCDSVEPGN
ncbi:hypothetical protein [Imhoffiella purpurea]|uniref:hypothetical protein n=1 Tax=Imhoffiella purpurea TaxID=1249627 RepID=UPI0005C1D2D6|nr:hypothetical protein [Imhoffiella purpurea]